MKKQVILHPNAEEEYFKLPELAQKEFRALFNLLGEKGYLKEPEAKKIAGYENLFELRIRLSGQ